MTCRDVIQTVLLKFPDLTVSEQANSEKAVIVPANRIIEVCRFCKDDPDLGFEALSCLSGLDHTTHYEIVYHLTSYKRRCRLVIKTQLDHTSPEVVSVEKIWKTANWYERECFDLLGIRFMGHPDPQRLLMPADWIGFPLRKDYVQPTEYHGIQHARANPLVRAPKPDEGGPS